LHGAGQPVPGPVFRCYFTCVQRTRMLLRLLLLSLLLACACAVSFTLQPEQEQCISELLMPKAILTGEWSFGPAKENATTENATLASMRVISPAAGTPTLFESTDAAGHFSVTATENGEHRVCVVARAAAVQASLVAKTALEVADHDLAAKREHVEALEQEIEKMENLARHVHGEMLTMRRRAEEAEALDASTRGRLVWVEVAMMCTLLVMGLWQINYLKAFFQAKKIL